MLYITGEVHYEKVMNELKSKGAADNMVTKPFLHQMPEYLKAIDVIVARAGATTIAEITARNPKCSDPESICDSESPGGQCEVSWPA